MPVFGNGVQPTGIYADPAHPFVFATVTAIDPNDPGDIAWTDLRSSRPTVNSSVVRNLIDGSRCRDPS